MLINEAKNPVTERSNQSKRSFTMTSESISFFFVVYVLNNIINQNCLVEVGDGVIWGTFERNVYAYKAQICTHSHLKLVITYSTVSLLLAFFSLFLF